MEQDRPPNSKAKLTEVNSYLTCYLCKGYYIDATTIVECLHSFCRSCIIQYLQQDPFCPICDLMINMAKPQIKPDKTLQDIVYKLVPGLYASEMCRRRKFWAEHAEEAQRVACPEAKGLMTERIIFSPQDAISLSIEYTSDDETAWNHGQPNRMKSQQQPATSASAATSVAVTTAAAGTTNTNSNSNSNSSEPDPEIPLRRYLQCPAMLRVEHLKKFICNKYSVDNLQYHIDILYKRVPLPDHYTLMDIAYIYSWKRNEPMKFYFRITDIALAPERFDYFEPSSLVSSTPKIPTKSRCHQQRATKQHLVNNNNNTIVKKSPPIRADNEINTISDNKPPVTDNQIVNNSAVENTKNSAEVKNNKNCDKVNKTVKCKAEKRKTVEKEVKQVKNECATDKKKISDNKSELKLNNLVSSEKENIPDNNDKSDTVNNEKCKEISDNDKQIKENSDKCETDKRVKEEVVFKIKSEPNCEFSSDTKSNKNCGDNSKNDETISNTKPNVPITIKTEIQAPISATDVSNSTENLSSLDKSNNKTENSLLGSSEEDVEKSNFLKSIQLTARSSLSPPNPNPTLPKIIPPILKLPAGQKRKYVRKNPKEPPIKKVKIENAAKKTNINDKSKVTEALTKMRRIAPKATKSGSSTKESDVKVRSIKNPIVRMIVSNMNKQSTNLNKIVGQTNVNETERLKSLIDSCKLNIPSSLSITLTESPRNEDGTIVETKPAPIKPVQNYIEILKLPETNVPSAVTENTVKTPDADEAAKKTDTIEKLNQKILDQGKNGFANMTKTQKQTFQTMFEEAIKRNENMKAQLYNIQNQAKNAEIAKKAANSQKPSTKKQQSNALDLSSKTSPTKDENGADSPTTPTNSSVVKNLSNLNLYVSTPTRPLKSPGPNGTPKTSSTGTNGHISSTTNLNSNGKRNILEIAHQLSKRSKLESENSLLKVPNSSVSPNSTTSRLCVSPSPLPKISPNPNSVLKSPKKEATPPSPPKQIIINNNFSSGGSISIKDSPKKVSPAVPKLPIPRLPVQKVPTPKLTMPIRNNNGLLKFSNYTAKLANSSTSNNAAAVSSSQTSPKANNSTNLSPKIPESTSKSPSPSPKTAETIHGMTPNQILEKYNITNLAQFNANLNHAQLAFQQALMVSHQLEMHRLHQQTNQKQWMNNPNILAHYENYVKSLKQQNQMCGNASKN